MQPVCGVGRRATDQRRRSTKTARKTGRPGPRTEAAAGAGQGPGPRRRPGPAQAKVGYPGHCEEAKLIGRLVARGDGAGCVVARACGWRCRHIRARSSTPSTLEIRPLPEDLELYLVFSVGAAATRPCGRSASRSSAGASHARSKTEGGISYLRAEISYFDRRRTLTSRRRQDVIR